MSFFNNQNPNEDEIYARIRDRSEYLPVKRQIEGFWQIYKNYAHNNFLREAQSNFHQRWWEMFLGVGLINLGFNITLSKIDHGPDFNVPNALEQDIWIEAVAPESGSKVNEIPDLKEGVYALPESDFLLRLTSAIISKRDKLIKYLSEGIVKENDMYIIAVSACDLKQYGSLMNFPVPAPLKILIGANNLTLTKDGKYVTSRANITKKSGANITTCLFEEPYFELIPAILYSASDPLNSPDKPEDTFQLFINPLTKSSLLEMSFNNIEIWHQAEKYDHYLVWKRNQKRSSSAF